MLYELYYYIFLLFLVIISFFKNTNNFIYLSFYLGLVIATFNFKFFISSNILIIFFLSFFWVLLIFLINFSYKNIKFYLNILLLLLLIFIAASIMVMSNNIYFLVIGFELMLVPSLLLLKLTIKTDRGVEAFIEMYIWGFAGSFFLLIGLFISYYYSFIFQLQINYLFLRDIFLLVGFSIKIPLWPFTSWLLKAHVEASTEFSIFLSGFLVKFGVIGLLSSLHNVNSYFMLTCIEYISVIGIVDASIKLLAQVDLKRIVALTTIIETNWLAMSLAFNNNYMWNIGLLLVFFHAMTTTLEFYLVEIIYKRFGTRSIVKINSLSSEMPIISKFFLLSVLITIGLPGSSIFILKFIFLSFLLHYSLVMYVIISIIFLFVLPIFFIKIYIQLTSGIIIRECSNNISDIFKKEFLILIIPLLVSVICGFAPMVLM